MRQQEKIGAYLHEPDAKTHVRAWKKVMERGGADEYYSEYAICRTLGWTWPDLMQTPERTYQAFQRITMLETKRQLRLKSEAEAAVKARQEGTGNGTA
ncbi:MAG: hypothetical protein WC683_04965 [bacterium]